jgi:hypothetical protein
MITAPIAVNHVMMPKIAPVVPSVLLSGMIVSEKQNFEKTRRRPAAIELADGSRRPRSSAG